jgi:hypothetical protein
MQVISKLIVVAFATLISIVSAAEDSDVVYKKRAITVYCNEIPVVLKKIGGDFNESWIDNDKNEWFNYTDVAGKVAILIKPADKPETICIVSYGKLRIVKPTKEYELPK